MNGKGKGGNKEMDDVEATILVGLRGEGGGREGEIRSGLDFLSFCNL